MRRLGVVLLSLLLGSVASAQEMGPQPGAAEEPTGPIAQATGTLTGVDGTLTDVDAPHGTITVARRNGTETYRIGGDTEVLIAAEASSAARLTVDKKVRVYYLKAGNPPYLAKQIIDADSIAILDGEREGVAATIESIQQVGEGDAKATVVTVTTVMGKRRELVVRPDGAWASEILKDGSPAAIDAFAAGQQVMVSVRRTSGEKMYLKSLADPPTYLAFLALRTLKGKVDTVAEDGLSLTVAVADQPEASKVRLTRRTAYFRGGIEVEKNLFAAGDEVVVKYVTTEKGVVVARALFAPDSWQAYAASVTEQPKPKEPAPAGQ